MAENAKELMAWLARLPDGASVGVDDGGLHLVSVDNPALSFCVGGIPLDDDDADAHAAEWEEELPGESDVADAVMGLGGINAMGSALECFSFSLSSFGYCVRFAGSVVSDGITGHIRTLEQYPVRDRLIDEARQVVLRLSNFLDDCERRFPKKDSAGNA